MKKLILIIVPIVLLSVTAYKQSVKEVEVTTEAVLEDERAERTAEYNPLKNLYFGQTQQHTNCSFDAAILDVNGGPETAYRHASGEKLKHPSGMETQLKVSLIFYRLPTMRRI